MAQDSTQTRDYHAVMALQQIFDMSYQGFHIANLRFYFYSPQLFLILFIYILFAKIFNFVTHKKMR